jgi:amino acid transporter
VRDPERTIPRATLLGIGISTLLYILGTIVVLGVVPREQLVNSTALFAKIRKFCDDDAIVELTEVIAWESASAKFNRALRVPSQNSPDQERGQTWV